MLSRARYENEEEMMMDENGIGMKVFSSSHLHAKGGPLVHVFEVLWEAKYDGEWFMIGRYLSLLSKQDGWSDRDFKRI